MATVQEFEEREPRSSKARPRTFVGIIVVLILGTAISGVIAGTQFSSGPLPGLTGARALGGLPGENNCTNCHYTDFGESFNTPGGAVEILDLPETYQAGNTYDVRVRLHSDSTLAFPLRKWGFEITALRESDGSSCGTFILPPGDSVRTILGTGSFTTRSYTEHTSIGTRTGLGGPVEWRLQWQAPAVQSGKVLFFAAGNAANGSLDPSGDFIFTTVDSILDHPTASVPVTWGALKTRYR